MARSAPHGSDPRGRTYGLVVYGASGFVGRQAVAYLAQHAPTSLRWAIAGRDESRLGAAREAAGADVDVLLADSADQAAIDAIVSRTRVVLSLAGPFTRHGGGLVDACVRFGVHYLDITGETPWVRSLIDRYQERAAADGTRIIPCSGFDAVPSDLGALLVARHLQRCLGVECARAEAFYRLAGGLNGGTVASAFEVAETAEPGALADPFLLNPADRRPPGAPARHRDPRLPMKHAAVGTWVAPFVVGAINTRVVRRSAALHSQWGESYGDDFTYQEYLALDGPLAQSKAIAGAAASAAGRSALRRPLLRRLLRTVLPRPGSGPSERVRNAGWFSCDVLGTSPDGRQVWATIRDVGDPANRATVTFACEATLTLVAATADLPGGPERGGVLTPATALGEVLVERLRRTGMTIDVGAVVREGTLPSPMQPRQAR
jgi:short subunit dehydrogenase-like uncharacterized protein